jgi:hypothetical protein
MIIFGSMRQWVPLWLHTTDDVAAMVKFLTLLTTGLKSVAKRVSEEYGYKLGDEVGCSIRFFEDCTSNH